MGIFLHAVQGVAVIVVLIAIGFYITGRPWFGGQGGPEVVSKLAVNLAIPVYLFYTVVTTYQSREQLLEILQGVPVPFFNIGILFLFALVLVKVLKVKQGQRGLFMDMVALSNTILVGIAVTDALFGPESTPYATIYYMANTLFFWTLGTFLIRRDAGFDAKVFSAANLRKVFAPQFVAFLLGLAVVLIGVPVPKLVLDVCAKISPLSTPLSMLFIGSVIRRVNFKSFRISKEMVFVFLSRFLFAPGLMTLACYALPIPSLMKKVFFMLSCMPVMTQTGLMAKEYNADYEYASMMITITTVSSMVFIPIYMFLIETFAIFG